VHNELRPAALTRVPRARSSVCHRCGSMPPRRVSPRCSHHVGTRRASGRKDAQRRRVSPTQRAREPSLPMRRSPPGGTAIRGAPAAAAGRARHRALPQMRRCAPGFARVYCPECRHDYLLAFSCEARYFCPSCHQKRVLAYGDWVEQNVLAAVPHRQYVFTVPRMLRPIFSRKRGLLGELCHIVYFRAEPGARLISPLVSTPGS